MSDRNAVIVMQNLTRRFGDVLAVEGLSLTIERGEVVGLLGPNGAGKTTTIRMLCALLAPSSGEVRVAGYQAGVDDQKIRASVGLLPETPGLYLSLSAARNLAFYGTMYDVPDLKGQVERYLRMLDLWARRDDPVGTFSKGMLQKLAIARAVLHEPEVLLLDEPTSGLDPQASRLVRSFIEALSEEGRTILLSTHNLEEADRLCDRIAVLKKHLLAVDTPEALRQKMFGKKVVFQLKEARPTFRDLVEGYDFVSAVEVMGSKLVVTLEDPERNNPRLVDALVRSGAKVQFVGELRQRLEDVYLGLMRAVEGRNDEENPSPHK
ncbi:MAG: ABC transporter ATP-binding protein [Anaerolineales bacterium]